MNTQNPYKGPAGASTPHNQKRAKEWFEGYAAGRVAEKNAVQRAAIEHRDWEPTCVCTLAKAQSELG